MASIDSVRMLLQSLPAQQTENASQSGVTTPLRTKNPQQPIISTEKPERGNKQMQSLKADDFWRDLHQFHERRGTPLTQAAKISGQHVDLFKLYNEVTERGGFNKVNLRDEWDEVYSSLETLRERCVNGTAGIKHIYRRYLDKYERLNFFGEDPDKMEALEAAIENAELGGSSRSRSRALAGGSGLSSIFGTQHSMLTAVPMAYNQRQHNINLERRRHHKLSSDLHKHSNYEKLMLSLLSPLPNEQDFAINVCTLMTNEAKHTLRLPECPKLLDALLAHLGVYADYTIRKLFQHGYQHVRRHSQFSFWRDLLHDKPQILELYTDEQAWRDNGLIGKDDEMGTVSDEAARNALLEGCDDLDFLNLGRSDGTGDYMGQRVLQIAQIVRSLSFHEENLTVLSKNRTLWRYLVMGANVRWSNIHTQALETAGNLAQEFELLDPTTDELSRNLLATICEGVDSADRNVIINCLEILYKLCAKEGNGAHINRCLSLDFYQRAMQLLSLSDVMLLIFTLEAIYALTSLGARACSMLMQVNGIVEQLVALLTVEAQSYGPEGCILMRVVEIVPGNMLPMVAQNIANMQQSTVQPVPVVLPKPVALPPPQMPAQTQVVSQIAVEQQPPAPIPALPVPTLPQVQIPPAPIASPLPAVVVPSAPSVLPAPPSAPQSCTHDDEQYALAWLGATYERTAAIGPETRVEQQELYRIYLAHCQKAGKLSVVNHIQFPRLVRLIFNQTVGPVIVRLFDGTELAGTHYVGIKRRAQALPMNQQQPQQQPKPAPPVVVQMPSLAIEKKDLPEKFDSSNIRPEPAVSQLSAAVESPAEETPAPTPIPAVAATTQQPSSSLIKSLLANKVTERQQKQKALVTQVQSTQPPSLVATTAAGGAAVSSAQPIKVTSTAISAFVNNPLMQHTPVKVGQTTIKPLHPQMSLDKKSPLVTDSAPPPLAPLSGANVVTKDASGRTVIIAAGKRKLTIDDSATDQVKRLALENTTPAASKDEPQVTPSKNAANLYADLAASILEDEDLDDVPPLTSTALPTQDPATQPQQQQQQLQLIPAKVHNSNMTTPAQRQLVFPSSGGPPQLKLATTATIKTDQGLQTVPVILQPKSMDNIPATSTQPQTQYVLATNQQGQTYLVAQQTQPAPPPPPPTQTLLVTQSPQQPGSGTKTIIILQQQGGGGISTASVAGTQKMLMTTAQGQQVLVTTAPAQPRPPLTSQQQSQQIFINPQRTAPQVGVGAGQMSPSLLSQLNQIPATIKLHQPQSATPPSTHQRLAKTSALPIPQLQQHQSIIQQHLISGPSEKRQVLLGGGRTIEIKETLITQTPTTPLQQSQLNSQTIITTQPTTGGVVLQQQQQHIRSVLEQQQQHHPSIIQQKISLPATTVNSPSTQAVVVQQSSTLATTHSESAKPTLMAGNKPTITPTTAVAKKQPAPALVPPNKPPQQSTTAPPDIPKIIAPETKSLEQQHVTTAITSVAAHSVTPPIGSNSICSSSSTIVTSNSTTTTATSNSSTTTGTPIVSTSSSTTAVSPALPIDVNWLFICDWRNCPRRKFKSLNELQHHMWRVHCPDHIDAAAEIYCQWGVGPNFCDSIPRKRYSLMTHLFDRHLTPEGLRASAQRRIATGIYNVAPAQPVVTIVRNVEARAGTTSPSGRLQVGGSEASSLPGVNSSALQAIKRHTMDYINPKELMDENEGPVTKSIRLTAALILRNLVNFTSTAKRNLRGYEPHLANVALNNVEASGTISHILYELSQ